MASSLEQLLRRARHILVATHVSPDPDGIGSLLAVGAILDRIGAEHTLLSRDGVPYDADFLPGIERIVTEAPALFDLAIVLDCSDPRRIGSAADRLSEAFVINIDHHPTNLLFGDMNVVDVSALSTCQIVYRLAATLGLSLTKDVASCLLAGLVGDTQCFRIASTDQRALDDAAALMDSGADLGAAARGVYGSRPVGHVSLWGAVLSGAVWEGDIVSASVTLAARRAAGVPDDDDAGIVNFLQSIRGTRAAVIFSERSDGATGVSLRSVPGVDVAAVAAEFGGGGHRQAAGCTVTGSMADVRTRVLARLRQETDGTSIGRDSG